MASSGVVEGCTGRLLPTPSVRQLEARRKGICRVQTDGGGPVDPALPRDPVSRGHISAHSSFAQEFRRELAADDGS